MVLKLEYIAKSVAISFIYTFLVIEYLFHAIELQAKMDVDQLAVWEVSLSNPNMSGPKRVLIGHSYDSHDPMTFDNAIGYVRRVAANPSNDYD